MSGTKQTEFTLSGQSTDWSNPDAARVYIERIMEPTFKKVRNTVNQLTRDVIAVSASQLVPAKYGLIVVDATSGPVVVTLRGASEVFHHVVVVKTDSTSNSVTVRSIDGSLINGQENDLVGTQQWSAAQYEASASAFYKTSGPAQNTERIPTQMVFSEVFKEPWFGHFGENTVARLMPPNLQWVNETFTDATTGRFTQYTEAVAGTLAISGGQATITDTSGSTRMTLFAEGVAIAMPQVSVHVDAIARTGGAGAYGAFLVGLVKDANNYIVFNWDKTNNNASLQTKIGGVNNFDGAVATGAWTFPLTLAFSLVGSWVTLYVLTNGTWAKVLGKDISAYVDFKAQDHSQWFGCFGSSTPNTVTDVYTFDNFKVGRFGGVGVRDVCLVSNEDGTTQYKSATSVRALATLGAASGGISESSMGLFTIDLEKKTFTQDATIMVNRGGKIQNDHAGHMILYPNGDAYLSVSSWGDTPNPTRVLTKLEHVSTQSLITGSHVVSGMSTAALTELPASGGQYDPWLVKRSGSWYMAYTATGVAANSFYPALDTSPDASSWVNVGKDASATRYEGTRILVFNGTAYLLTGGAFNMRQYDLAMTYQGIVNCLSPGNGTTQPHAMIFQYNDLELLITFDETVWPTSGGLNFSWGQIRWSASPRY